MAPIAIVPLVVAIVGALIYAFAKESKPAEIGRLAFFVGLFVFVWLLAGAYVIKI